MNSSNIRRQAFAMSGKDPELATLAPLIGGTINTQSITAHCDGNTSTSPAITPGHAPTRLNPANTGRYGARQNLSVGYSTFSVSHPHRNLPHRHRRPQDLPQPHTAGLAFNPVPLLPRPQNHHSRRSACRRSCGWSRPCHASIADVYLREADRVGGSD